MAIDFIQPDLRFMPGRGGLVGAFDPAQQTGAPNALQLLAQMQPAPAAQFPGQQPQAMPQAAPAQQAPQAAQPAARSLGPSMTPNAAPAAPQAGGQQYMMGGGLGDFLRSNPTMISNLAAGLMSGSRGGVANAVASLPGAQQHDRQNAALKQWMGTLPEEQQGLARAFPQVAGQSALQAMFAPPAERRIMKDADGRQRYVDTGDFVFSGVGAGGGEQPFLAFDERAQTPGQKEIDKAFGRDFVAWSTTGRADTRKQLEQLREAKLRLDAVAAGGVDPITGKKVDLSGYPTSGLDMWGFGDAVRTATNPAAQEVKEAVEEVVQRNLRTVLGAQFAQREGEQLIKRAYNPGLSEEENAKRVGRLIESIVAAAEAKEAAAAYFERNGTLYGWNGQLPTMSSIESGAFGDGGDNANGGGVPAGVDPEAWKYLTPEERALWPR